MPKGGTHGRGKKSTHKGGSRHFTTPAELEAQEEKLKKEKEWRRQKGIESESSEEGEGEEGQEGAASRGAPGELPPSGSDSDFDDADEDDDEDKEQKAKGVEHLIEIENPNRILQKAKKVTALGEDAQPAQLSRREREEIAKQEAKQRYQAMHEAGKTEEAQADLARLAIIRKQREDAIKKREEEKRREEELKKKEAAKNKS